ncbi:hypothetical protein, partial [Streptomyces sp. NPDC059411]|uniref:hypothetical protein n=1 Tax=Streptomyces sp. NPDC059411 TaxID=3346825 RepID=UPI0036C19B96
MKWLWTRTARVSSARPRPLLGTVLALTVLFAAAIPAAASPGGGPGPGPGSGPRGRPAGGPDGSSRPGVAVAQGALRGLPVGGVDEFLG